MVGKEVETRISEEKEETWERGKLRRMGVGKGWTKRYWRKGETNNLNSVKKVIAQDVEQKKV